MCTKVVDLSPLKHLPGLEDLDISHTGVKDIKPLMKLEKISYISLSNTPFNDLSSLMKMTSLREVHLGGLDILAANFTELQNELSDCEILFAHIIE